MLCMAIYVLDEDVAALGIDVVVLAADAFLCVGFILAQIQILPASVPISLCVFSHDMTLDVARTQNSNNQSSFLRDLE